MTRVFHSFLLALITSSLGFATTIAYNGNDYARGLDITFQADAGGGLAQENTFAGVLKVVADGNPLAYAFCVDLFVPASGMSANSGAPSSLNGGTRVAWLLENAFPLITSEAGYAGLQLAIWDIVHDNGDGFDAGRIQRDSALTDAAVLGNAGNFLSSSTGMSSNNAVVFTHVSGALASQTLITGTSGVPEPATLGLVAGALAALGTWRRRSVKQA